MELDNEDDVEPSDVQDNVDLCAYDSDEDEERVPRCCYYSCSTSNSSYSNLDWSDVEANVDSAGYTPDSPLESTQQANERIRGSAASCKRAWIPGVIHEQESDSVDMNNAIGEQEHHGLDNSLERERVDHRLDSTARNVAIGTNDVVSQVVYVFFDVVGSQGVLLSKNVIVEDVHVLSKDVVPQDVHVLSKDVIAQDVIFISKCITAHDVPIISKDVLAQDVPVLSKNVIAQDVHVISKGVVAQDVHILSNVGNPSIAETLVNNAISSSVTKENRLKKMKHLVLPTIVQSRKPPKFARKHDASNSDSPQLITKSVSHSSVIGDGKTISNAIPFSPSATKSQTANDGNTKDSAIPISPTTADAQSPKPSTGINMCRAIVVLPAQQQQLHGSSDLSGRTWKLSPLVGAHLGVLGLGKGTHVCVSAENRNAVRNLTESLKKIGVLSRFAGLETRSAECPLLKRKRVDEGGSSSMRQRDNRPGMFTPPSFDLHLSSQETTSSGSSLDIISSQEYAIPNFAMNAAPLACSKPEGPHLSIYRNL
ncbi:hypothetical protein ACQ4PT_039510 [Festuca glaucescens]